VVEAATTALEEDAQIPEAEAQDALPGDAYKSPFLRMLDNALEETSKKATSRQTTTKLGVEVETLPQAPSRRRGRSRSTTPKLVVKDSLESETDLLSDNDSTILPLSPSSRDAILFRAITAAITSQPRSMSSKHPTWYEKILMYDPILLEDLTRWLNTDPAGLAAQGWEEEIGADTVMRWCRERSVCCLWKESGRNRGVGGVKKIGL
jgi:hypothetical protein